MSGLERTSHPSRRIAGLIAAIALATLTIGPAVTLAAPGDIEITLASDTTWRVEDADVAIGPSLSLPANAQHVCLNDSYPSPCPAGATLYGWVGGGWDASLSGIPGATWIWAPGITPTSEPADLDTYYFAKEIDIPGVPTGGSISVAADDGAQIWVNGTSAGSTGSPSSLTVVDITSLLRSGANEVVIQAANGLICNETCTYTRNPGGVVFGGTITYAPSAGDPDPTARPTVPPTSTLPSAADGTPAGTPSWLLPLGVLSALTVVVAGDRRRRHTR